MDVNDETETEIERCRAAWRALLIAERDDFFGDHSELIAAHAAFSWDVISAVANEEIELD